jgi:hypothetical protein
MDPGDVTPNGRSSPGAGSGPLTVFPERTVTRTATYQARKLRACGVDPALYAGGVETGLFGQDCFKAMTAAGQTLDGMVHMAQRFALRHVTAFDEPLTQRGWIASDEAHARGRRIVQMFEFTRADGSVAAVAEMFRLKPDPAKMGGNRSTRKPDEDPRDGLDLVCEKVMRPEDVTGFSEDVGNLIHFDPDFAARYGYRAPISQGIQTMVWMMSALARDRMPKRFDVTARFIRPVYWDDALSLWGRPDAAAPHDLLRAINAEGKTTAELRVDAVAY